MKKIIYLLFLALCLLTFIPASADDAVLTPGMSADLQPQGYYLAGGDIPAGGYYFTCPPVEEEVDSWCDVTVIFSPMYYMNEDEGLNFSIWDNDRHYFYLSAGTMIHVMYRPVTLTVAEPIVFK